MNRARALRSTACAAPAGASRACPRSQRLAVAASVVWATVVLAYAIGFWSVAASGQGRGTLFLDALFFLVTLAVPIVLVWLAAFLAAELARQRELIAAFAGVAAPLLESLAATRDALERQSPTSPDAIRRAVESAVAGLVRPSDLTGPLDRLAAGQSRLQLVVDRIAAAQPKRARERTPPPAPELQSEPELALVPDLAPDRARRRRHRPPTPSPTSRRCPTSRRPRPAPSGRPSSGRSTSPATPTTARASAPSRPRSATTGSRRCSSLPRTC